MHNSFSTNDSDVEYDMNESLVTSWNGTPTECGVELSEKDMEVIAYYRSVNRRCKKSVLLSYCFRWIIHGIFGVVLSILGIIGNIVSLLILMKR